MRGTIGAARYDLSSSEAILIPGPSRTVVRTGLAIVIPVGTYARIALPSRITAKRSNDVGAGVVEADYRAKLGFVLINDSDDEFRVQQGDRIANFCSRRLRHLQWRKLKCWKIQSKEHLGSEVLGFSEIL